MELKPLNDQVVVVVGASSGIGRETARRFAEAGAQVVISARNQEGLESLAEEIGATGGPVVVRTADVADLDQVKATAVGAMAMLAARGIRGEER